MGKQKECTKAKSRPTAKRLAKVAEQKAKRAENREAWQAGAYERQQAEVVRLAMEAENVRAAIRYEAEQASHDWVFFYNGIAGTYGLATDQGALVLEVRPEKLDRDPTVTFDVIYVQKSTVATIRSDERLYLKRGNLLAKKLDDRTPTVVKAWQQPLLDFLMLHLPEYKPAPAAPRMKAEKKEELKTFPEAKAEPISFKEKVKLLEGKTQGLVGLAVGRLGYYNFGEKEAPCILFTFEIGITKYIRVEAIDTGHTLYKVGLRQGMKMFLSNLTHGVSAKVKAGTNEETYTALVAMREYVRTKLQAAGFRDPPSKRGVVLAAPASFSAPQFGKRNHQVHV
jgi:hypothetical protein